MGKYVMSITATENSFSVDTNSSDVTVNVFLTKKEGKAIKHKSNTTLEITCDNSKRTVVVPPYEFKTSEEETILLGSYEYGSVYHNDDGTKTANIDAEWSSDEETVVDESGSEDFSTTKYTVVTPTGTENPSEEGWYVSNGIGGYVLSTDTTVDTTKTYYIRSGYSLVLHSIKVGEYSLVLEKEESDINPYENTSDLKITAKLIRKSGYPITHDGETELTIECDGKSETITIPKYSFETTSEIELGSVQFDNISHNDDGTKEVDLYATWDSDEGEVVCKVYVIVSPSGTENPSEEGWYEENEEGNYVLTTDTEVDESKTYYEKINSSEFEIEEEYELTKISVQKELTLTAGDYTSNVQGGGYHVVGSSVAIDCTVSSGTFKGWFYSDGSDLYASDKSYTISNFKNAMSLISVAAPSGYYRVSLTVTNGTASGGDQVFVVPSGSKITISDKNITIGSKTFTTEPYSSTDVKYEYSTSPSWNVTSGSTISSDIQIVATYTRKIRKYKFILKGSINEVAYDNIEGYGHVDYKFTNPTDPEATDPAPSGKYVDTIDIEVYYGSTFTMDILPEDGYGIAGALINETPALFDTSTTISGSISKDTTLLLQLNSYCDVTVYADSDINGIKDIKEDDYSVLNKTKKWLYHSTHSLTATFNSGTEEKGYAIDYWEKGKSKSEMEKITGSEEANPYELTVENLTEPYFYMAQSKEAEKTYDISVLCGDYVQDIGVVTKDESGEDVLVRTLSIKYSDFANDQVIKAIKFDNTETIRYDITGWFAVYLDSSGEIVGRKEVLKDGKSIISNKITITRDDYLHKYFNESVGTLYFTTEATESENRFELEVEPGDYITSVSIDPDEDDYAINTSVTLKATVRESDDSGTYSFYRWGKLVDGEYEYVKDVYDQYVTSPELEISIEMPTDYDEETEEYKTDNKYIAIGEKTDKLYTLSIQTDDYFEWLKVNGETCADKTYFNENVKYGTIIESVEAKLKTGCDFKSWSDGDTTYTIENNIIKRENVEIEGNTYLMACGKYVAPIVSLESGPTRESGNITFQVKVTKGTAEIPETGGITVIYDDNKTPTSIERTSETSTEIIYTITDKDTDESVSINYVVTIIDKVDTTIKRDCPTISVYVKAPFRSFALYDSTEGVVGAGTGISASPKCFNFSNNFKIRARRKRTVKNGDNKGEEVEDVATKDFYTLINEDFYVVDISSAVTLKNVSMTDEYAKVEPEEGDNPKGLGWYEKNKKHAYVLTEDTKVNTAKIYYTKTGNKNWKAKLFSINNFKFLSFVGSLVLSDTLLGSDIIGLSGIKDRDGSVLSVDFPNELPVNITYEKHVEDKKRVDAKTDIIYDIQCGSVYGTGDNCAIKLQTAVGSLSSGTVIDINVWLPIDNMNVTAKNKTEYLLNQSVDKEYRYVPLNLHDNGACIYEEIVPTGEENPSNEGWFEKDEEGNYFLSDDSVVYSTKTYFTSIVDEDNRRYGIGVGANPDSENEKIAKLFSFGDDISLSVSVDAGGNVEKNAYELIDTQFEDVKLDKSDESGEIVTNGILITDCISKSDLDKINCYLYTLNGYKFLRIYGSVILDIPSGYTNEYIDFFDLTKLPETANVNIHFSTCVDNMSVIINDDYEIKTPTEEYSVVTPKGSENPKALGWYEKDSSGNFSLSTDTSVNWAKQYYEGVRNPSEEGWYEKNSEGNYVLTTDTRLVSGKTYYVKIDNEYFNHIGYLYNSLNSSTLAKTERIRCLIAPKGRIVDDWNRVIRDTAYTLKSGDTIYFNTWLALDSY